MKLEDFNLFDIGTKYGLVGAIFAEESAGEAIICLFPDFNEDTSKCPVTIKYLNMNVDDWVKFLRQTDILETEVLLKTEHGQLSKAILRKSQRAIDSKISWNVMKRDHFKCRYCGCDDRPITMDHVVLWEEGGPSTADNMVSACKKCNKTRGNMQYEQWLDSKHYLNVSQNLSEWTRAANDMLVAMLDKIPRVIHIRSRG